MSLLDDVSIVVTPNGYKAGELYAVIPVPTEGTEEVTNGDFATDLSGWDNKSATSTWVSGSARIDNSTGNARAGLYQDIGLVLGNRYILTATMKLISGDANGNFKVITSTFNGSGQTDLYTGESLIIGGSSVTETIKFTHSNSDVSIQFACNTTNAVFEIDNVSVKEYTSADMDVTRETAATRVDENGLVNYAEIVGSEEVTDGSFPSGTTAWSDGTGVTLSVGKAKLLNTPTYSFSLSQTLTELTVGLTYLVSYEIDDYFSGQLRSRLGSNLGATISDDGVYEELITAQSNSLIFQTIGVSFTGSIKNVSVKEVTRDNVPRIDYTGGGCPHILAEPQRTNEVNYSEDFSQWTPVGSHTAISNTTLSNPSGVSTVGLAEATTGTSVKYFIEAAVSTVKSTVSIYLKYNSHQWVQITGLGGKTSYANFDIQNGVLGNSSGCTSKITLFGDGWYRCELSELADQNGSNIAVALVSSGTSSRLSNTTLTGSIYMWGAQLEEGSYGTSYIPNFGTAAGVTRNQDIFTRDGIGSLINSTEGVLFAEIAALADDSTYRYMGLTDGTDDNRVIILYYTSSTRIRVLISSGGTKYFDEYYGVTSILDFHKVAVKFKENDFALWIDGVERVTDTSGLTPVGLNTLALDQAGGSIMFAKVKQLQVYKTALTDEQLLQLTGESGTDFYESYAEMASALTYTIQ